MSSAIPLMNDVQTCEHEGFGTTPEPFVEALGKDAEICGRYSSRYQKRRPIWCLGPIEKDQETLPNGREHVAHHVTYTTTEMAVIMRGSIPTGIER